MTSESLTVYIDYKSPYAYLAIGPTEQLQTDFDIEIDWLPYTLDIPDFLGSAKVDHRGNVLAQDRTAHQWRRVRYSYMDARRYANLRGLTIRGPQKIWNSTLASIGLLYAKAEGKVSTYNRTVYERFWKRELNIESEDVIKSILQESNIDVGTFDEFVKGEGLSLHNTIRTDAEEMGVFGVPTYVLEKELYWGREHLPLIRTRLQERGLARAEIIPSPNRTKSNVDTAI